MVRRYIQHSGLKRMNKPNGVAVSLVGFLELSEVDNHLPRITLLGPRM